MLGGMKRFTWIGVLVILWAQRSFVLRAGAPISIERYAGGSNLTRINLI